MVHVITGACCSDARCVTACPLDVIHPRPDEPEFATAEMLHIDPKTCIDCGACADACPVDAIVPIDKLLPSQQHFVEVNADYFVDRPVAPFSIGPTRAIPVLPPELGGVRVAIVGSGPAGMYAAEELLRHNDIDVDVFERLLTPWGLVRSGVAPDHPETKAVAATFETIAREKNLRLRLGVEIGTDVSIDNLRKHYHAVIVATGAPIGRALDIPGTTLPGSLSAHEFAGWYNGHPDAADKQFDLSSARAIVVGNGNVALDIVRILLADPADLADTDIAPHALEALRRSRVEEVQILGRRGPRDAAFSESELTALATIPGLGIDVEPHPELEDMRELHPSEGALRRKLRFLRTRSVDGSRGDKRIVFRFDTRVTAIHDAAPALSVQISTGTTTEMVPAALVIHAIGHDSQPIPGIPTHPSIARTPNAKGRITDDVDGTPITGLYTVGWHKRGATGVIGTNRNCSQETVGALLADLADGRLTQPTSAVATLDSMLAARGIETTDLRGWHRIDTEERRRGQAASRPRSKIVRYSELSNTAHP
ncbi:FAD-dependent oxidoreductase [Rhodococcus sp. H36-A4]|uniref:FAD-dependent oxidoreductase n=1 Tax=Rhodococcus sp. H36-A4 TaxID=3004353 RepID=UPI0022B04CB8|nr:FAD-dependent oxidoreductase [Rhodococcus sp. H36-A4]MCZ4076858.1 FAD-dependent oxidoreductase [Rhodococcus sp. H36-A4]